MTEQNLGERRAARRLPTRIDAIAWSAHGARHKVEIIDLSTSGCAVVAAGHPLIAAGVYGIKMGGLESLATIAAWSTGQASGLTFERPLHPAIADHIAAHNPAPLDTAEKADV